MADSIEVQISGLEEAMRALRELPERVEKRILGEATKVAAQVLERGVQLEISALDLEVDAKGTLVKALQVEKRKARRGEVRVSIGILSGKRSQDSEDDAFFWRWVEYGTMPRYRGNRGRYRADGEYRYQSDKRTGFTGQMKMQPFLRPAFEATAEEAILAGARRAKALTDRVLARAAKGKS